MMKWGRRNKPSLSHFSSFSRVLPVSWLSRFKRMSAGSGSTPAKEMKNEKRNSVCVRSPMRAGGGRGRFYGGNGDAFWRLSFGEDSVEDKGGGGGVRSVWYESDDELDFPPLSCRSCGSNAMRAMETQATDQKLRDMAWDVKKKKKRGVSRDMESLPEINTGDGEKGTVIKTPRITIGKDQKLKRRNHSVSGEIWSKLERNWEESEEKSIKSIEKDISELETAMATMYLTEAEHHKSTEAASGIYGYSSHINAPNVNSTKIAEYCAFAAQNLEGPNKSSAKKLNFEWQKMKAMKIEELKSKSEQQRKSVYVSRELQRRRTKQGSKVRVFSPRAASKVEICKIKALEDMKKAKLKMKAVKEKSLKGGTGLESFAVVKCSFDPQKDFRDSMIEMIMEKRINRPEELEELLASYLTLNSDEYHDLIIKVFRQVWFDLNQACFNTEIENEQCSSD